MVPKPFNVSLLSERAQKGLNYPSTGPQNLAHSNNPFCPQTNQEGIIKLSSAGYILCEDLVRERFGKIDWSKFDAQNLFIYPRRGGEVDTLKSMADFINHFCRSSESPLTWEEIILIPGVTTCADLLGQILFDPGEVLLVPAPYYYRFANDFGERGLVEIFTISALSDDQTKTELKVEKFEQAYQKAIKQGLKVRAITLVNPQNPEGCFFSIDEIKPVVQWALERKIFVILDEIYDLTIYDEHPKFPFQSACSLFEGEAANYLIWIWGISKNFSLPGLRFAVLHSPNETIRTAASRFVMHHLPNTTTQFIAREFLSDYDWVKNTFIPENHKRLKATRDYFLSLLNTLNVPYIKPRSGFFVLVDFSRYLDEESFEAEDRLNDKFFQNKVMITPGRTMYCGNPGWFRIVFTSVERDTLTEAFNRIVKTLESQKAT
ncbi:ACC synthase-like protein [Aphelenchoides bicaudatus]|nr:ACC synthase-like protein [Aphelenchoides bicaudatus]